MERPNPLLLLPFITATFFRGNVNKAETAVRRLAMIRYDDVDESVGCISCAEICFARLTTRGPRKKGANHFEIWPSQDWKLIIMENLLQQYMRIRYDFRFRTFE
jgi:hypothetical protein